MAVCNFEIIDELGKIDLNQNANIINLYTYWCRVVYTELEHWNIREHAHSFWELHLCISGSCRMQVDGKDYVLTPNSYLFLGPKTKHTILFESDDYSKFVWGFKIDSNEEMISILADHYKYTGVLCANEELLHCIFLITENAKTCNFGSFELIKNELYHLFILLARKTESLKGSTYHKESHSELALIKKYICENLSDNINLDEIASLFYLSKSSIERMCRKEYRQSFAQMKRSIQADVIRNLLRETDFSFDQIASMTGFSDRYSLGKFFKKHEGSSPGDYRKGIHK